MSVTHRGRPVQPAATGPLPSPEPRRVARRRWQDPRLWLGVLLVAVSVIVGARLLAGADDTVAVWRVTTEVEPGAAVTTELVEVARVRFDDDADAAAYLSAAEPLPDGLTARRPLGAGELLPATALTRASVTPVRELPLGVEASGVPTGLAVGDRVEVWAVPEAARGGAAEPVLVDVAVTALSSPGATGIATDRQVLVALPAQADLGQVLDALNGDRVVLVRVGG